MSLALIPEPSLSPGSPGTHTAEPTLTPGTPSSLAPQVTTPSGYPGQLVAIDGDGVADDAGAAYQISYNESGDRYLGDLPESDGRQISVEKSGGFWKVFLDAVEVSTGPADSGSPVGSYAGTSAWTVATASPVRGVMEAEPMLSPGSPGRIVEQLPES